MQSKIIEQEIIRLTSQQEKMIISGWGEEAISNSKVYKIVYQSDVYKVRGYFAIPQNIEAKIPVIIWNRGGALNRGYIDEFSARGMFGLMASWGYAVFASMYRGSFENEGKEEFGGADVNDVLNLIPSAESFDFIDITKWGIEGWSRGGLMTYLTLLKDNRFKCAVLNGAISDLRESLNGQNRIKELFQHIFNREVTKEELDDRSPILFTKKLPQETKYLLLHGGADETISPIQTLNIAKKFSEENKNYKLIIYENGDHFLKSYRKEVDDERRKWYDKYLKEKD